MLRKNLFLAIGRISAHLPAVRGRTRIFLELYKLFGLQKRHVMVDTVLKAPVPYRASLDLHSWLQKIAFLTGAYEPDLPIFMRKLAKKSGRPGYFLDVGANIGLICIPYSLMVKAEPPAGRSTGPLAVALEAVPTNFLALKRNAQLNDMDGPERLLLLPYAVGNVNEQVEIQIEGDLQDGEGTGTANIMAKDSTWQCVRIPLEVKTIDTLVASGTMPTGCSVIKIDTDGYDLKVLQGARSFLQTDRPVIFGEFSAHCMNWHGQSITDVQAYAREIGYSVYRRIPDQWRFVKEAAEPFVQDLLLVPDEERANLAEFLAE